MNAVSETAVVVTVLVMVSGGLVPWLLALWLNQRARLDSSPTSES